MDINIVSGILIKWSAVNIELPNFSGNIPVFRCEIEVSPIVKSSDAKTACTWGMDISSQSASSFVSSIKERTVQIHCSANNQARGKRNVLIVDSSRA